MSLNLSDIAATSQEGSCLEFIAAIASRQCDIQNASSRGLCIVSVPATVQFSTLRVPATVQYITLRVSATVQYITLRIPGNNLGIATNAQSYGKKSLGLAERCILKGVKLARGGPLTNVANLFSF